MNYTKGKWEIQNQSGSNPVIHSNVKAASIASVNMDNYDCIGNAHLIAAAPMMYEALKDVQNWLMSTVQTDNPNLHPAFKKANNATIAAIKAAEGKE